MEDNLLEKIQSKYIKKGIFNYIKDEHFSFKLIKYSKRMQKEYGFNIFTYQEKYVEKSILILVILYPNIMIKKMIILIISLNILYKTITKKLKKKFPSLNFTNLISCYYNLYLHEYKNKTNIKEIDYNVLSEIPIDIFSPAFNLISQEKIFEEIFTAPISIDLIEAFNLKKDYLSFFEKMNKSNSSLYSKIFNYKSNNDFDYLKEFNVNFDNMEN
jgi:hypothetical protein